MKSRPLSVLFLCTGNSARSIMAEALLNAMAPLRFKAYSAGSQATGTVNPLALELLQKNGLSTAGLRSKSWSEFAAPGAPQMDLLFTVCDTAAAEICPVWPGQPVTAHWGICDPAAVEGDEEARRRAFLRAYGELQTRLSILVSLPIETLDRPALQRKLEEVDAMGRQAPVS